jgi:hypothetical protein
VEGYDSGDKRQHVEGKRAARPLELYPHHLELDRTIRGLQDSDGREGIACLTSTTTDHAAKTHTMVAQHCWGLPYARARRPITGFDPRMHIAITFDPHAHPRSCGYEWWRHLAGPPGRRSGSRVVDQRHSVSRRAPGPGSSDRALVGTRTGYLFTLAQSLDPSLEPALALAWPSRLRTVQERLVIDG